MDKPNDNINNHLTGVNNPNRDMIGTRRMTHLLLEEQAQDKPPKVKVVSAQAL
jgi:hypothetical protein